MDPLMTSKTYEWGLLGLALMVIWKLLEVGKVVFLARRSSPDVDGLAAGDAVMHQQQVREIHNSVSGMMKMIDTGRFECQWRDRDEVRDLVEIMRGLASAVDKNTTEVQNLARELRLTRNGHGRTG